MKNWEQHFRSMRRRALTDDDRFDFGTIGGAHTVAELRDLLAAHSYSVAQTQKAINDNTPLLALHPDDYILLFNDWNVLLARWNAARGRAQAVLSAFHPLPENMTSAEAQYVGVLQALQITYPRLFDSPGDLVDIVRRLAKLNVKPDFSAMPQPRAGTDTDFETLKASNAIIQAATPSAKSWVKFGALGLFALVVLKKLALL